MNTANESIKSVMIENQGEGIPQDLKEKNHITIYQMKKWLAIPKDYMIFANDITITVDIEGDIAGKNVQLRNDVENSPNFSNLFLGQSDIYISNESYVGYLLDSKTEVFHKGGTLILGDENTISYGDNGNKVKVNNTSLGMKKDLTVRLAVEREVINFNQILTDLSEVSKELAYAKNTNNLKVINLKWYQIQYHNQVQRFNTEGKVILININTSNAQGTVDFKGELWFDASRGD